MSEVENKTEQEALDRIKEAMARALKADKWMVGVLWVENGKVAWSQNAWKFPLKGHEDGVKTLAKAIEKSMAAEVSPPGPLDKALDFLSHDLLVGASQNGAGKEEEKPEAPKNREVRQGSVLPKEVNPFDGPGAPVISETLEKTDPFTGNGSDKPEVEETKDEKDVGLDT